MSHQRHPQHGSGYASRCAEQLVWRVSSGWDARRVQGARRSLQSALDVSGMPPASAKLLQRQQQPCRRSPPPPPATATRRPGLSARQPLFGGPGPAHNDQLQINIESGTLDIDDEIEQLRSSVGRLKQARLLERWVVGLASDAVAAGDITSVEATCRT